MCDSCFREIKSEPCEYCGYKKIMYKPDVGILRIGTVLKKRYIIGEVLGKGGFGVTYKAYDTIENKIVAIKEYYPNGLVHRDTGTKQITVSSKEYEENFKVGADKFFEEAKMVSRFNGNPNIVNVYEFFLENGTVYFSMEFLDGIDLKHFVKKNGGKLPQEKVLYIANIITDALLITHSMNVLHRDISPDNIFILNNGEIKLIDFGAARQVLAEQSRSISVILKQGFAPLEQYQRRGKQGPWTDIYALGATLYYALTGKLPDEVTERLDYPDIGDAKEYNVDEEFWNIIRKCMEVRIADRYQSIFELKEKLNQLKIKPIPLDIQVVDNKDNTGVNINLEKTGVISGSNYISSKKVAVSKNTMPETVAVSENAMPETVAASKNTMPETVAVSENAMPETVAASKNTMPETVAVSENAMPETVAVNENAMPETAQKTKSERKVIYSMYCFFIANKIKLVIGTSVAVVLILVILITIFFNGNKTGKNVTNKNSDVSSNMELSNDSENYTSANEVMENTTSLQQIDEGDSGKTTKELDNTATNENTKVETTGDEQQNIVDSTQVVTIKQQTTTAKSQATTTKPQATTAKQQTTTTKPQATTEPPYISVNSESTELYYRKIIKTNNSSLLKVVVDNKNIPLSSLTYNSSQKTYLLDLSKYGYGIHTFNIIFNGSSYQSGTILVLEPTTAAPSCSVRTNGTKLLISTNDPDRVTVDIDGTNVPLQELAYDSSTETYTYDFASKGVGRHTYIVMYNSNSISGAVNVK